MTKLLSIVIPVYKVEDYIRKCIESLIVPNKEQLKLLDIVIINDGTPDKSAVIAHEYEAKYPNVIRVIDQENRGHGGAWNHGTQLAVGKYLFYLDSDDWFDTNELSKLIDYLKTVDTDMVMMDDMSYYAATGKYSVGEYKHKELTTEIVYNADKFNWLATGHGFNMTYAHDTVYRTDMLQKYLPIFCEHVMYDDVSLQAIPIAIAKDFIYTKRNVYRYYIGREGQSFDPKVRAKRAANDIGKVLTFVLHWYRKHWNAIPKGGTREAYSKDMYQSCGTWHYYELCEFPLSISKPALCEWDKIIRTEFPDIKEDKNMRLYRTLPTWLFVYRIKLNRLYQRGIKFVKRKLSSNDSI
ncbi:MAG: glycosyltransferase [Paludibacteraceae bacterium]|nr:glycosyltransferase [Paludibacteraceae bacterium]